MDALTFPDTTSPGQTFDFDGELTAEENHPYAFSATSTFANTVPVTAADRAGNITPTLAAIFNDNVAPTVALTVPTSAGLDFSVAWAATDAASGVRAFNLGYGSSASGPWTAWLTATTDLSAAFLGLPDESYYFRVQAVDNVGNVSSWRVEGPVTINTVTKYYYHGGQRVAMRQGDGVYYLSGDHLGSTSLTTDSAGQVVHQARYLPYGQERWSSGAGVTDFTYTGQRVEAGFGLYDYNARFYSGRLGRFVSADTIVPEPKNSQAFNRYGYANNNPIRYKDPSGHGPCDDIPGFPCDGDFFKPLREMWNYGQMQVGQAAYDAQQATGEAAMGLARNYVMANADAWQKYDAIVNQNLRHYEVDRLFMPTTFSPGMTASGPTLRIDSPYLTLDIRAQLTGEIQLGDGPLELTPEGLSAHLQDMEMMPGGLGVNSASLGVEFGGMKPAPPLNVLTSATAKAEFHGSLGSINDMPLTVNVEPQVAIEANIHGGPMAATGIVAGAVLAPLAGPEVLTAIGAGGGATGLFQGACKAFGTC